MRWTKVCPLLGAALLACATEENAASVPGPTSQGGSAGSGGSGASAGRGGGTTGGGSAGGASGATNTAGTSGQGGSAPSGGTFSNAGNVSGGTFSTGGSSGAGGAAGSGGAGGAGGAAGSGGAAGASGTGGMAPTQCTGVVIPPKSGWQGSALRATENDPPSRVFDGDDTTRFATGAAQMGDEWLQIDFGEVVTMNEVRLHTNNNDYFRHFQLRLSNTSQDFTSAILHEADGAAGTVTVPIAPAKAGRYLTIRQTGAVAPTWWSLHEVSVACN